jgi:hypothetical protein
MPERLSDQDPQARVKAAIAERVQEQMNWIETSAQAIGGENASVEDIFELPPDVRDEAPTPAWNPEQEAIARELGEKLGYAAEQNVPSGTRGGVALLEGGKAWKIMAEAEALKDEVDLKSIVVSGSPYRQIGTEEKQFMLKKLKDKVEARFSEIAAGSVEVERVMDWYARQVDSYSEYDVAMIVAESLTQRPDVTILPLAYGLSEENPLQYYETGQFMKVGITEREQDVILMRVDREIYTDDTGQSKYRHQPDPVRRMGLIADILEAEDDKDTSVIFVTSNAYASRAIDAIRAGLKYNREFAAAMYGRATLAEVKSEEMLPGARLNQLPGDIRVTYENLKKLYAEVA